jgi:hypothetical protein
VGTTGSKTSEYGDGHDRPAPERPADDATEDSGHYRRSKQQEYADQRKAPLKADLSEGEHHNEIENEGDYEHDGEYPQRLPHTHLDEYREEHDNDDHQQPAAEEILPIRGRRAFPSHLCEVPDHDASGDGSENGTSEDHQAAGGTNSEAGPGEVRTHEAGPGEIGAAYVGGAEVGPCEVLTAERLSAQVATTKVSVRYGATSVLASSPGS